MKLGNIEIGVNHPPLIIAELSANHNQDLKRALLMIEKAAKAGVKCVKLQTFTADSMTLDVQQDAFVIQDKKSLWQNYSLHTLYDQAHLPWEWHKEIFKLGQDLGIAIISTPFDERSVDFLEKYDVPFYKIASFENVDLPLIKKVAETKKPMIISCGLANVQQISEAVECARANGAKNLVLLKCTSQYPANPKNINLKTLPHMRELFNCEVGLSDHTQGIGVSIASVAFGATVIEKHFILSKEDQSLDSEFSLTVDELGLLQKETKAAWNAVGEVHYGTTEDEENSLQYRRSLYVCQNINKGEVFSKHNIRAIRPGYGLEPKYLDLILGRKVVQDLKVGTPLNFDFVGGIKDTTPNTEIKKSSLEELV